MPREVKVITAVDGDQVKVGMRHFEPDDGKTATVAVEGFFDRPGDGLGEGEDPGEIFFRHIEEIIDFCFGYDQGVAFPEGKDIQEGIEPVVFGNLIGRDLSCDDL